MDHQESTLYICFFRRKKFPQGNSGIWNSCQPAKLTVFLANFCSTFMGSFKFTLSFIPMGSLVTQMVKNLPAMQETQLWSLGQEDPWRRKWQPAPIFLPGKSHGQRSLAGYSPWGCKESDTTEHRCMYMSRLPVRPQEAPGVLVLCFLSPGMWHGITLHTEETVSERRKEKWLFLKCRERLRYALILIEIDILHVTYMRACLCGCLCWRQVGEKYCSYSCRGEGILGTLGRSCTHCYL